MKKQTHCIMGCESKPHIRGLCVACHKKAQRMIEAGDTSWQELEWLNMALPRQFNSRETHSGNFLSEFIRRKIKAAKAN